MNFPDPTTYPIVFLPKEKEKIFLAIKEFPVSFAFDSHPRQAIMNSMVVEQLETFFISQDIYKDESVAIFDKNVGSNIELLATDRDITKTDFSLKFYINRNEFKAIKSGQLQTINQPTGIGVNIEHLFIMTSSTIAFNAYNDDGDYYYPAATLKLNFYPYVKNTSYIWTDIILPDQQSTPVVIAPVDCYGLLDVIAEVKIKWYLDPERTSPTAYVPVVLDDFKFGIRFCISNKGSLFKNAVQLGLIGSSQGTAIATSLYSTSTLQDFNPYALHNIFYWGSGELKTDLFYDRVDGIEIADNGLPIQSGSETAVYILANPLPDIYFSSSSSSSLSSSSISSVSSSSISSVSSLNSSSSSLSSSSSSVSSVTSLSTDSSLSSLSSLGITSSSSQSHSTGSSVSSSSTDILALSSSSSLSSSTHAEGWTSSSSSIEERVVLYYGFANEYNTFKEVEDESGNGYTATMGGALPIATWSDVDGIHGGRYIFSPSGNNIQYISSLNMTDFSSLNKGTISIWAKLSGISLLTSSSMFAITNEALVEDKTELIIGFSIGATKEIIASISIDGEVKWTLNAELTTDFVGNWYNFVLVQNGTSPSLYVNGLLYPFTFSIPDYKSFWINSLFSYSTISKPQQMMLATTLRNYFPYKVLGFSGELDEIKMWNTNLSSDAIYQEYLKIKGLT